MTQGHAEAVPAAGSVVRRLAFGLGSLAVTVGVLLHLPMFIAARDMHYVLAGMPMDTAMVIGMVLIVVGMAAVVYGLLPLRELLGTKVQHRVAVSALDETKLGPAHYWLLAVLTVAIAVDSQKPFTFAFILPGVAKEYGLSSPAHAVPGHPTVALLPFFGILGTVLGSLIWGYLGDRFGRRTAILLAAMIFVSTSICGAMPSFSDNVIMCFVMGLGAGGLLPIAYALLAETIPAKQRGQIVVLVAGVGTALGFLVASVISTYLMPEFGWRIMWFFGLPTGLVLIVANRFIPESPRFLLENGRAAQAYDVMHRFGVRVVGSDELPELRAATPDGLALHRRPLVGITAALVVYGLGWGIVNFGFLTWLPTDVARHGLSVATVSGILTNAALFSLPGAVVVSWLYGRWSSKGTMVLVAALTAASLAGFAIVGEDVVTHTAGFTALLVALLVSLWGVIAVLAPYSAEVYPTRLRASGAGVAAGASKLGGVLALSMGVARVAPPGLAGSAALTAGAMALGAVALAVFGIETRRRRLEEIVPVLAEPVPVGR